MEGLGDIESFLDVENSFSAKWLANTLRINLQKARTMMEQYKANNAEVSLSYLVVGMNAVGSLSIQVAGEAELEDIRSTMRSVRSEEVFSLHKLQSVSNNANYKHWSSSRRLSCY